MSGRWDGRLMELAELVATWSKDPNRRVGAVVVDARRRVVGVGYNGPPPRAHDGPDREDLRAVSVHAELNAVLNSAPGSTRGATVYCTSVPCAQCAAALVAAEVARVVCPPATAADAASAWSLSWRSALQLLDEAGVEVARRVTP